MEVGCSTLFVVNFLFTMKVVELIHLSSKTLWEEVRPIFDAGISLVSNPSTVFTNNLMSNAESCNNWMERLCIIVGVRRRIKMNRELN